MDIVTYSNQIVARTANGIRQTYEYDGRGQLLAVKNADGTDAERYAYDKAGNMVKKKILRSGRAGAPRTPQSDDYITTTFTFDGANQLVSSTTDGVTTKYAYDAAGRLVKEGSKTYRYGYLDKVLSVTDGKGKYIYTYHADGQLAKATVGGDHRAPRIPQQTEDFLWDGLALVKRGGERFINEPHIGGGNPVVSSAGKTYFNDMLGTTLGSKAKGKYSAAALSAFGEQINGVLNSNNSTLSTLNSQFFTGKPYVPGLGHAFLFRNYRAGLAKWQTADPVGYPDGWNQLAYCGNDAVEQLDFLGAEVATGTATWDWRYQNEFQDVWTGYSMVLECNVFTVRISYHIVEAPKHIPVIVVDSIQTNFQCNTSDAWSLDASIPIKVKGNTVNVGASTGYSYRVDQRVYDPIYWSDDKYNYVSQTYKFNIYSYDWINVFGFEMQYFDNLETWTDVTLLGKCRKE